MRISNAIIHSVVLGTAVALSTPIKPRTDIPAISTADDSTAAAAVEELQDFIPGAYIVELADDEDGDAEAFYRTLAEEDGVEVEHRMNLSSRLFKGASFQIRDTIVTATGATTTKRDAKHEQQTQQFLASIKAKPRVKNAWPVRIVKLKGPQKKSNGGGQEANFPLTTTTSSSSSSSRMKRQSGEDTFSPHISTQVSRLHADGITGKGIRIAVIDSGVDWKHPALGGCFGPDDAACVVQAGYDFTGDDYLPPGTPKPDDDPYDDCVGHGTHVAGIIAAQAEGNDFAFTGAAPGARLAAYRAWGCRATSTNEILIQAFVKAWEDGADVISCSDGDPSGWADDAWGLVASRIVEAGVPVVISEGNDGGAGLFMPSTPATGRGVTGVGASTNTHYPVLFSAAAYYSSIGSSSNDSTAQEFGFLQGSPQFTSEVTLPLWPASNNTISTSDACSPLPDDTPDLSDRIVLLRVPENKNCYPIDQGTNIAAKGGRYLIYYAQDNLTIEEQFVYSDGIEGVAIVAPYQGAKWIDLLNRGETVTVAMPNPNNTSTRLEELENTFSGGYMADFSSWGPTWELAATPQLAAPGGHILSTYLMNQGGYRVMSGTSMSCPLVAAIYALLAEARGGAIDPPLFRRLLLSTSKPQAWFDGVSAHDDIIAPVPQQGAGIVQAYDAAHATAVLSVDSISFNDSDHFVGEHTFSIENIGTEDLTLQLGHESAATMYTFIPNADVLRAAGFPNPIVEGSAEIRFSSDTITVPAGSSANVTVTGTPPTGLNATLLPVYSGYITLTSSNNNNNNNSSTATTLRLPYLGVAGSLRSTPVLQPDRVYLADYNLRVEANRTYMLPQPNPGSPPRDDESAQPNVIAGLTVGTRTLRVDVVSLGGDNDNGTTSGSAAAAAAGGIKTLALGPLPGYPLLFAPRDETRAYFKGFLADGTVLPAGAYKLLVSALRVFGDAGSEGDWDVLETVPFIVEYEQ